MTQYAESPIRHARNPRRSFNWTRLIVISTGAVLGATSSLYLYVWLERLSASLSN